MMKKKMTKILCLVLAAVFALGMFSACDLIVVNNKRDMEQVVAEVNVGNDAEALEKTLAVLGETLSDDTEAQLGKILATDEIYKRDLVAYFLSYGYNYYSSSGSYASAFASVMNDLVNRKLQSQFATVYYLNAGTVRIDRDSVDNKKGYMEESGTDALVLDKTITADGYLAAIEGKTGDEAAIAGLEYFLTEDEINYAHYIVMSSVNSAIDSFEKEQIKAEEEDTSSDTETRTVPTGANELPAMYYPSVEKDGKKVIDYDIYTGSNNVSDCGEYEKVEGSTKYYRTRAYAQFISRLRQNYLIGEDEKDVSDIKALSYYNVELKTQMEQLLINKFAATLNLKAAESITQDIIESAYETQILAQKESSKTVSSYTTTMDSVSDTSFIVYSPEGRTYGFVYNILLPFSTNQSKVLDEVGNRYTAGTKEYYAARNTNSALLKAVEAKDQRESWFNGSTDYSYEATGDGYYKNAYNSAENKTNYLFFEDSFVTDPNGKIDRYAGKYPFNGTAVKQEDDTYKLTYNKLKIDEFIDEMESYIGFVSGETATGGYLARGTSGDVKWTWDGSNGDTFYSVTAADFPKDENGKIDQSANIYYKGTVSGVYNVSNAYTLVEDEASYKAISAVNELMFAYSTDTGCLNKYYGYSIDSEKESTSYVAEFEFAAQAAVKEGVGTYYVVATDYGWHIIYVSFVYDGGEVFEDGFVDANRNEEGTFSYYFYQAKKNDIVSDYTSSKQTQINAQLNNDSVVTLYEKRYSDLTSIA